MNKLRAVAVGLGLLFLVSVAAAQAPPHPGDLVPKQLPGDSIESVAPESYRKNTATDLIHAIAPPPPPAAASALRCPEPPKCPPDSELPQFAFLFIGIATAGMFISTSWAVMQQKKTKIIRDELSRIRIHRTSQIRADKTLAEVTMPPRGLGRAPQPPASPAGPKVPLAPLAAQQPGAGGATPSAARPVDAERVREEAESRLATAQADLGPLLDTVRSVEQWFRSREFESLLDAAGSERATWDRLRRGVVAVSATFHSLRDARIFARSLDAIDEEIERYWEQVYESLDDVYALVNQLASERGRDAFAGTSGDSVRAQIDRLLEGARGYLATDQRRPIAIEPLRTDFDRRIHQAVESRKVPGVPPNKVVSVIRCGIIRDGKLVRKPEVVQSL